LSIIDIIIIVPLVIGAYSGYRKGFIMEVVSLLALILAVIGGFHFLHWGISLLHEHFNLSGRFMPVLSFILIFAAIVLVVNLVGKILKKVAQMAFLGGLDKVVGAILGGPKWVFFLSLVVWAFQVFGVEIPEHLQEKSLFYSYIIGLAPATVEIFSYLIPASANLLDKISELLNFAPPAN